MHPENDEEKFVRKYFEGMGYASQKLDQDTSRKLPDFLFTKEDLGFLAEVKNIEEQKEFEYGFKVVDKVTKILDGLQLDYGLSFTVYDGILEQNIKRKEIEAYIRTRLSISTVKIDDEFELNGKIRFTVKNIKINNKEVYHLGIYGLAKKSDAGKRIKDDIKDAVKKYKNYNESLPFVLILFPKRIMFDDFDLFTGMFGDLTIHLSKEKFEVVGLSRRNSSLQPSKNTSIGAVAVYKEDYFDIYHNPNAAIKFPYGIFNYNANKQYYVDNNDGEFKLK